MTGLNQLIHKEVPYYGLPKSLDPILDSFLVLKGDRQALGLCQNQVGLLDWLPNPIGLDDMPKQSLQVFCSSLSFCFILLFSSAKNHCMAEIKLSYK